MSNALFRFIDVVIWAMLLYRSYFEPYMEKSKEEEEEVIVLTVSKESNVSYETKPI